MLWHHHLMQNSSQNSFLKLSLHKWTLADSSENHWSSLLEKKSWGYSDLKLHSCPCLYYLCPLITTLGNIGELDDRWKKEWCNQTSNLVSGAQSHSGGLIHASLMNSSRTSVMLMYVKEHFDFCNVWVRAPHQICCSGKGGQMAVVRDITHKPC